MGINRKAIKSMFPRGKWRFLRGDNVYIATGKDKGQVGTITKVIRDTKIPRVLVQGRNLNKRFVKRSKDNPGGIVSVESPIHYSNISHIDPVTGKPTRTSFRFLEDGTKVRVTQGRQASGSVIPRPDILKQRRKPVPLPGDKDTAAAEAKKDTYVPQQYPEQWLQQLQRFPMPAGKTRAPKNRECCTVAADSPQRHMHIALLSVPSKSAALTLQSTRNKQCPALLSFASSPLF